MQEDLIPDGAGRRHEDGAAPARPKRRRSRWRSLRRKAPPWFFNLVLPGFLATGLGIGLTLAFAVPDSGGSQTAPPSTTDPGNPETCAYSHTKGLLTVEDDFYLGAWTQSNTGDPTPYPRQARPANGVHWLPNCTNVRVKCARSGRPYTFQQTIAGRLVPMTWKSWAQLADGSWLRLADVVETYGIEDPAVLHLPAC